MPVRYSEVDEDAGQRIDNYLLRELRGVPRSRVYRMLRKGEARVNGRRIRPDYRLRAGDVVRLPPFRPSGVGPGTAHDGAAPPRELVGRLEQAIVFEDDDLLVLDKPSGLAVHGGSGISHGVIEAVRALRPSVARLELGHRIDRDTSGCLVMTKNRATLLALHRALRENRVRKCYEVIVHGHWPTRRRSVQLPLRRFVTRSGERRVVVDSAGKPSRTDYSVITHSASASRLEAYPRTGRTHQIRVHCQASGCPVVGDEKYGTDAQRALWKEVGVTRLALHARSLKLELDGTRYVFEAPPPPEFEAIWEALGD